MAGSPTPSSDAAMHQYANVRRLSGNQMSPPLPRSFSSGSSVLRGPDESQHGRPAPIDIPTSPPPDLEGGSPPASLDPTSYHAAPISPVGDVGPSSSPPTSPSVNAYSFSDLPPLGTNLAGYFDGTDKSSSPGPSFLRREKSTASNLSNESRPGSLFYGEGVGVEGTFRPESIVGNFGLYGRPGSTASMGGSGDQFQMLLRHAHECVASRFSERAGADFSAVARLAKMLKEAEARLATSASSYEEDHTELEGRLEEVSLPQLLCDCAFANLLLRYEPSCRSSDARRRSFAAPRSSILTSLLRSKAMSPRSPSSSSEVASRTMA